MLPSRRIPYLDVRASCGSSAGHLTASTEYRSDPPQRVENGTVGGGEARLGPFHLAAAARVAARAAAARPGPRRNWRSFSAVSR